MAVSDIPKVTTAPNSTSSATTSTGTVTVGATTVTSVSSSDGKTTEVVSTPMNTGKTTKTTSIVNGEVKEVGDVGKSIEKVKTSKRLKESAENFKKTVDKIKKNIIKHGIYAPMIRFTVLNTARGDVTFTTENSGSGQSLCCITSLQYQKTGCGKANAFTLQIAFSPSKPGLFYNSSGNLDFSNANLIDEILNVNAKTREITECEFEYGYSYPINLMSPKYKGMILNYTVEISNGILLYTITGYSEITAKLKDSKVTIYGNQESKGFLSLLSDTVTEIKDIEDNINNIDDTSKEEKKDSTSPIKTTSTEGKVKVTVKIEEIFNEFIKPNNEDCVLIWGEDTYETDKPIDIPTVQDVSPLQYIKTLLGQAVYESDTENTPIEQRSKYEMLLIDNPEDPSITSEIHIIRTKPLEEDDTDANKIVRFSWMGPTSEDIGYDYAANGMVIDFKTDFNGSIPMSYDYSDLVTTAKKVGVNALGKVVETTGTTTPTTGANTENENNMNLNLWISRLQNNVYTATLVTIGIPTEINILDPLYVAPMIGGQEHHTGGVYEVESITDNIDTSGYITTMNLHKKIGKDLATRNILRTIDKLNEELKDVQFPCKNLELEKSNRDKAAKRDLLIDSLSTQSKD